MALNDFGLESSSEPFVDVMLLLTACSFTLLVGIIIGYYVEVVFRRYKMAGNASAGSSKLDLQEAAVSDPYASIDSSTTGISSSVPHTNLKLQYIQRSTCLATNTVSDAKALSTKPSKVLKNNSLSNCCSSDICTLRVPDTTDSQAYSGDNGWESALWTAEARERSAGALGGRADAGGLHPVVQGGRRGGADRVRLLH